jgi:septal ring factor EnvC (AmiA/AmiB activator)
VAQIFSGRISMAEVNKITENEEISKAVWHYVGIGVLWLSLMFTGLALERLGLTSGYLTSVIPGEVNTLKKQVVDFEANQRKVMDENQRLKGLIGREAATSDALNICQGEKKKLEDELKQAKAGN